MPKLVYFPLKGRGEAIRLALALSNVAFEEEVPNRDEMKSNREAFPFAQCPRYTDENVDLVQSNTILRYLGRKHGLMGSSEKEHCGVDMAMEGVESLRSKYLALIYQDQLADDAKAAFWTTHFDKSTSESRNGGAHALYLSVMLGKSKTDWIAGTEAPSVADVALFDIVDLQLRIFKEQMCSEYPDLVAHHAKVAALPGVKEFLASNQCFTQANGNSLG